MSRIMEYVKTKTIGVYFSECTPTGNNVNYSEPTCTIPGINIEYIY